MDTGEIPNAELKGYEGPFYPEGIDELNHLYRHDGHWNGKALGRAARLIPGYVRKEAGVRTSDGYVWFWALEFRNGNGGIIRILCPWSKKRVDQKLSKPDCSIAVYTRGEVGQDEVEHILLMLKRRLDFRLTYELPALKEVRKNRSPL